MFFYNTFFNMAKSTSGGTRAMLRGRVASDVYSIGKTSTGKRQQVVRSLAEQVKNPQTIDQMRGRMIMSTVMQAVSALKPIIDHSFDGFPAGQPSISEFIRRNYALIKADVAAHPSEGNSFGLNMYKEKGIRAGQYLVSNGEAIIPAIVSLTQTNYIQISVSTEGLTMGSLKSALGFSASDSYLTLLGVRNPEAGSDAGSRFMRFSLNPNIDDATAITSDNVSTAFITDGNDTAVIEIGENGILLKMDSSLFLAAAGIIFSDKQSSGWVHSSCTLVVTGNQHPYTADVALPTYPIGTEMFLNGGDL